MVNEPVYIIGIPVYFFSLLAFGVALLYAILWPKKALESRQFAGWEYFLLRWGHSLSWLFLGLALFLWGSRNNAVGVLAAVLGGITYLMFMVVLVGGSRRSRRGK